MSKLNAIKQIGFPESVNQGFEIVIGSRIDKYLAEHPRATEAEAYQSAKASLNERRHCAENRCRSRRKRAPSRCDRRAADRCANGNG